jgi:ActR/RegA family two-component response regulator
MCEKGNTGEAKRRQVLGLAIQCRQSKALTCRSNLQPPVHNPLMRVLIADRNARLLESISRTFAQQFTIQTASSREHCDALLGSGAFDLAVISEKLADGPGLQVLGEIARNSPDTLRIFAARRSRLELLKGKLGPFGLFRTLSYPIDAQKLFSALTLARAGLETEAPELTVRQVAVEERQGGGEVAARLENEALPRRPPHGGASTPSPSAVRPIVKPVSLASADALISINVPMVVASMRRVRPSRSSGVAQPAPVARQSSGVSAGVHRVQAQAASNNTSRDRATTVREQSVAPESPGIARQPLGAASPLRVPKARGARSHSLAQTPPLGSLSGLVSRVPASPRTLRPRLGDAAPKRSIVMLGAAIVAVFLVVTLALNRFDAADRHSSDARVARASSIDEQPAISAPPQNSMPFSPTPAAPSPRNVEQRAEPRPDATEADVGDLDPKMAASTAPIADPSSFGSEAYEAIYSN